MKWRKERIGDIEVISMWRYLLQENLKDIARFWGTWLCVVAVIATVLAALAGCSNESDDCYKPWLYECDQ